MGSTPYYLRLFFKLFSNLAGKLLKGIYRTGGINANISNGRSSKLWIVNTISFLLFIFLFSTGLINWLVLPRGYEARGNFGVSLRHFLIGLHEWAGLIFMVLIAIHIALHWPYVKSNLKKHGIFLN
jgi:Domain of unknown function (DUF4405)